MGKMIVVSDEVWEWLTTVKARMRARSYDEVLRTLRDELKKRDLMSRSEVARKIEAVSSKLKEIAKDISELVEGLGKVLEG